MVILCHNSNSISSSSSSSNSSNKEAVSQGIRNETSVKLAPTPSTSRPNHHRKDDMSANVSATMNASCASSFTPNFTMYSDNAYSNAFPYHHHQHHHQYYTQRASYPYPMVTYKNGMHTSAGHGPTGMYYPQHLYHLQHQHQHQHHLYQQQTMLSSHAHRRYQTHSQSHPPQQPQQRKNAVSPMQDTSLGKDEKSIRSPIEKEVQSERGDKVNDDNDPLSSNAVPTINAGKMPTRASNLKENDNVVQVPSLHSDDDDDQGERLKPYASLHQAERSKKWLEKYEELKEFKAKHGHVMVPYDYNENRKLGSWVKTQRYAYRVKKPTLTKVRIQMLEKLGFELEKKRSIGTISSSSKKTKTSIHPDEALRKDASESNKQHYKIASKGKSVSQSMSNNQQWHRNFQELIRYKEKYGDCLVAQSYPRLGEWVHTQRKQYRLMKSGKASRMTSERIQLLERTGFVWHVERFRIPQKRGGPSKEEVERLHKVFGAKRGSSWGAKPLSKNESMSRVISSVDTSTEDNGTEKSDAILSTYCTLSLSKKSMESPNEPRTAKKTKRLFEDLDVARTISSLCTPSNTELLSEYSRTPTQANPPTKKSLLRRCTPDYNESNTKPTPRSSPTTVLTAQAIAPMQSKNKSSVDSVMYPQSRSNQPTKIPMSDVNYNASSISENDDETAKSLGFLLLAVEQMDKI